MPSRALSHRCRGLTLIELIVVMAILVLLVVLTLPAIQLAREAARKTQCKDNLKSLGLALHNYHGVHSTFPPGFVLGSEGVYHGWGWGVMIQPFLDSSPYYSQIHFEAGLQHEYGKPHMHPVLPVFRCPSDPGTSRLQQAHVVTSDVRDWRVTSGTVNAKDTFSRTNYFGMAGFLNEEAGGINYDSDGEPPTSEPHVNGGSLGHFGSSFSPEHRYCDPKNFGGIFSQNSHTEIRDIVDGTSNTIMVGERYTPDNSDVNSVGHGTWIGLPDCSTTAGLAMTLGDTSVRPNSGAKSRVQTTGFGSVHKGGTHFVTADGAVKFIRDTIAIPAYRKAADVSGPNDGAEF